MAWPAGSEEAGTPAPPGQGFRARSRRRKKPSSGPSRSTSTATAAEPPRVFAVDKPRGKTSHDVVAVVRRVLPGAKVGHAGTLDPDATGVLVICVGKATKISSFLMEGRKEYAGTGCLGVTTDSQDATGEVLHERPVTAGEDEVRGAVADFIGDVEQIPPMYSAVKVDGQRLYRLARKGVEVEREPRRVKVYSFDVDSFELPRFRFVLECSKGTYVRTLLHDLGERLGCGGHLERLTRTRQGSFRLEDAVAWDDLLAPGGDALVKERWVGPEEALSFLEARPLPASAVPRKAGEVLPAAEADPPLGSLVRLTASTGGARGVGRVTEKGVRILNLLPAAESFGRGRRSP